MTFQLAVVTNVIKRGRRGREERSTIRPNVSQAFNVRTKNFAMEMETGDDDDGGRMVDASHDFGHDASGIWCVNEGCSWCSLIKACVYVCVRVFFLFFSFFRLKRVTNSVRGGCRVIRMRDVPWEFYDVCHESILDGASFDYRLIFALILYDSSSFRRRLLDDGIFL